MILIYITVPARKVAKDIAKNLIEKKLIACANIFTIDSIYMWENKLQDEPEFVLLAKTTEDKYDKVKVEVEGMHPYDVPCILKIPVDGNEKFCDWIKSEVSK